MLFYNTLKFLQNYQLINILYIYIIYFYPITFPSNIIVYESFGYIIFKSLIQGSIPNVLQNIPISQCYSLLYYGLVKGTHDIDIWFNRPHGPPSGVWTGQTKPHYSGNNFLTVVVFISVK